MTDGPKHSVRYVVPDEILAAATMAGVVSPCRESQRGAVLWDPESDLLKPAYTYILGFNHPPKPFRCDGSPACRASCGRVCVHAEMDCLLRAGPLARGWEMLHVKVEAGLAVPSGPPSCWQCSRAILEAGVGGMWLLHAEGLRRYTAEEFHEATLDNCGLHVAKAPSRRLKVVRPKARS